MKKRRAVRPVHSRIGSSPRSRASTPLTNKVLCPAELQEQSQYFRSLILYEDSHLLLVYKPAGLPVQSDRSGDYSLLDYGRAYLIEHYQKPGAAYLSLPHRLDRPVAGLCMLAKTGKAMQRLSSALQSHQILKYYIAIVQGQLQPNIGIWYSQEQYLRKEAATNKSYICKATATDAKLVKLRYACIAFDKNRSIVVVQLESGRHHQIRCQLAALQHPIQGDLKYGARRSNPDNGISLFAYALQVPLPIQAKAKESQSAKQPHCRKDLSGKAFATLKELGAGSEKTGANTQVLQCICSPWEWQELNSSCTDSIWQLCSQEPGSRAFLKNILTESE